jgi:chromosome segregation ATPase
MQTLKREENWPADLDALAALDMRGEYRPPVTPRIRPAMPPEPPYEPEDETLKRKLARTSRLCEKRGRAITELRGRLRRRDARVESLEKLLAEARAEIREGLKRAEAAAKELDSAEIRIEQRDATIAGLRSGLSLAQRESGAAKRAMGAIQLRAHDWLELREGKRVVREVAS